MMSSRMDKVVKALQHEKESHEKKQGAYEGQLADLRTKVNETFDQILQKVYGGFNLADD